MSRARRSTRRRRARKRWTKRIANEGWIGAKLSGAIARQGPYDGALRILRARGKARRNQTGDEGEDRAALRFGYRRGRKTDKADLTVIDGRTMRIFGDLDSGEELVRALVPQALG